MDLESRQATADVLCALLEGEKKDPKVGTSFCDDEADRQNYNDGITLAQDIIRATLSNKDV